MAEKIILLHGLFMTGSLLAPLRKRLEKEGFTVKTLTYASIRRRPRENAARLLPHIREFAAGGRVHFVGHSLGGLVLRHLHQLEPELFHNSKVITLGTPHHGSKTAAALRPFFGFLINNAWQKGLDGNAPAWDKNIPLLSIAGTQPRGIGRLLRIFPPEQIHDGTVLESETHLPEACQYQRINASHTLMLYKKETAALIATWLRNGK